MMSTMNIILTLFLLLLLIFYLIYTILETIDQDKRFRYLMDQIAEDHRKHMERLRKDLEENEDQEGKE